MLAALLSFFLSTPALADFIDISTYRIVGYIGKTDGGLFEYRLSDDRVLLSKYQLKGVKDIRPTKERHPYWWKFRGTCHFMGPILSAAGSVFQIVTCFRS